MRPEALETDLDHSPGLLLGPQQRLKVLQGSDGRLLQIDVRTRSKGDCGQFEVRTERRGDDYDVNWADCRQCLGQIGIQIHAIDDGWVEDDSRIDGRDQLDQALIRKPSNPLGMDLSEPPHADQNETRWRI